MCRAGGRRCPSSVPRSEDERKLQNGKRRWKYAVDKVEDFTRQTNEQAVSDAHAAGSTKVGVGLSEKYYELRKKRNHYIDVKNQRGAELAVEILRQEAAVEPVVLRDRAIPSADELGFTPAISFGATDESIAAKDESIELHNKLAKTFTAEESEALNYYAGSGYREVNRRLRSKDLTDASEMDKYQAGAASIIPTMDRLTSGSSDEVRSVYRGFEGAQVMHSIASAEPGSVLEFPSYTSTSTSPSVALMFSQFETGYPEEDYVSESIRDELQYRVIVEMRSRKGYHYAGSEREVIMPRNTRWRVIGKKVHDGDSDFDELKKVIVVQVADEDYLDELEKGTTNSPAADSGLKGKDNKKNLKEKSNV